MKAWWVLIAVFLLIEAATRLGSFAAGYFAPRLTSIDPGQVFIWGIIHHLVQMSLPLLIMLAWPHRSLRQWGFRKGNAKPGMKWVGWLSLAWIVLYGILTLVNLSASNVPDAYYDVGNIRNISGELIFRGLIVGPSEEVLFRAFPIVILGAYWKEKHHLFGNVHLSTAAIIAALIFSYAHFSYSLFPFEILHFNFLQMLTALGLGLVYGYLFEKTGSLLYPVLLHAVTDLIPFFSFWILQSMG